MKKFFPIILASLLFAFVLTLQLPIEIYTNNIDEFSIPLKLLIYTFGGAFLVVFTLCLIPAVIRKPKFLEKYFCFLAISALLIWFNAHFMFGSYGAFDGRGLSIQRFSFKAIFEALCWGTLLLGAVIFSKKIHKYLFQACGALLVLILGLTGYQAMTQVPYKNETPGHEPMSADLLTFSSQQNIIHIVLDEQQSTIVEHLLQTDPSFSQKFQGFIFFPNTAANYRSTVMAIPAMLTGKVYRNDSDKNVFLREVLSNNPFTNTLEAHGFDTQIYTMPFYCNKAEVKHCIPQPELSPDLSAYILLDYSLFKAVPDIVKPSIYRNDHWLIHKRFVNPNLETTFAGLNHLAFQYFNEHFKVDDRPPTYKFYHSMITHSPAVLDKDCHLRLTRISRHDLSGKADQASCAFSDIFTFLENLKQAGIYDNTLIIISSDHGANYLPPNQNDKIAHSKVDERHYTTALATLFIKPFNAQGPLRRSEAPIALNDIPNTILTSLKLPLLPNGVNAFSLSEAHDRKREFVFYEFDSTYWDDSKLPPLTIYSINGDVREIKNWELLCADEGGKPCEE